MMLARAILRSSVLAVTQPLESICSRTISHLSPIVSHLGDGSTQCSRMSRLLSPIGNGNNLVDKLSAYGPLGCQQIRSKVRVHFPRPSEIKRIRKHGWKTRMSTKGGRAVIMARLLKGRHVLTH